MEIDTDHAIRAYLSIQHSGKCNIKSVTVNIRNNKPTSKERKNKTGA
jgi:hypothetical protein